MWSVASLLIQHMYTHLEEPAVVRHTGFALVPLSFI